MAASPESPRFPFKRLRVGFASRTAEFVLALALCHNVTPTLDDFGNLEYQPSSPDEIAIVRWTHRVGLTLISRSTTTLEIGLAESSLRFTFEILAVFPFTSDRKRMGILVRDTRSLDIYFYIKGADTVMAPLVQRNDWLEEETGNMAREGLRTLVLGRKKLTLSEYEHFDKKYQEAKVRVMDRAESLQWVLSEYLEKDLELMGLTGVEDKLQVCEQHPFLILLG